VKFCQDVDWTIWRNFYVDHLDWIPTDFKLKFKNSPSPWIEGKFENLIIFKDWSRGLRYKWSATAPISKRDIGAVALHLYLEGGEARRPKMATACECHRRGGGSSWFRWRQRAVRVPSPTAWDSMKAASGLSHVVVAGGRQEQGRQQRRTGASKRQLTNDELLDLKDDWSGRT
jgi:hypothetical protein